MWINLITTVHPSVHVEINLFLPSLKKNFPHFPAVTQIPFRLFLFIFIICRPHHHYHYQPAPSISVVECNQSKSTAGEMPDWYCSATQTQRLKNLLMWGIFFDLGNKNARERKRGAIVIGLLLRPPSFFFSLPSSWRRRDVDESWERKKEGKEKEQNGFRGTMWAKKPPGFSLSLSCCFVYINVFIYPHIHSLSLWCLTLGDLGGWLHGVRRKRRNGRVTIQLQVSQPGPFFFSFFLEWFSVCVYFFFFLVICYRFCHSTDKFLWESRFIRFLFFF